MSSTRTLKQLCTTTPILLLFQYQVSFRLLPSSVVMFILIENFLWQSHGCSGMNYTYGIHHRRIL